MTRTRTRRKQKRRRQMKLVAVWAVVYLVEILMAAAPAALTAAVLIPITLGRRGQFAVGGEWLLIAIIFCLSFWKVHNAVCDRVFGEEA